MQTLDKISYIDNVYVYCNSSYPFKVLEKEVPIRENAYVYVYRFPNGYSQPYYLYLNSHVISKVENGQYKAYSEIFSKNWHYEHLEDQRYYTEKINGNKDLFIDINKATPAVLIEHFKGKQSPERPVYDIFLPTKWKKIALDDKISPDNGVDTDGDSLTDWDEVDTIRLIWRADGSFSLPEIKLSYILRDVSRFKSPEFQALLSNGKTVHYLPIISDPSLVDSDGDGMNDDVDPNKLRNDFKVKKLRHDSYLRLDHHDLYQDTEHKIYYGSSQDWFSDFKSLSELYIFCRGDVDCNTAAASGCGLIAAADTIAYLTLYNNMDCNDYIQQLKKYDKIYGYPTNETTHTTTVYEQVGEKATSAFPGYNTDNDTIDYFEYINYARLLSHKIKLYENTGGALGFGSNSIKSCFNDWFKSSNIPYEAKWRNDNSRDTLYKRITSMIDNNIPVILSFDNTHFSTIEKEKEINGKVEIYYEKTRLKYYKSDFTNIDSVASHYMVVTELIDCSEEISKELGHKTMLKVSSSGIAKYIDLDEYCDLVNRISEAPDSPFYISTNLEYLKQDILKIGVDYFKEFISDYYVFAKEEIKSNFASNILEIRRKK